MQRFSKSLMLASLALGTALAGATHAAPSGDLSLDAPAGKCDRTAIQAMVGADTTIETAVPTALPAPHCRIDGFVITTNPGPNKVRFRLQLPDHGFNGRYLFAGEGGAAGYVPSEMELPHGNPVIRGFAMAGTDTGHSSEPLDWSFMQGNPAATLDYNHRGGHVATVAAQAITRSYYGINKLWRYHSGCSGGGRMGVAALEHHPEDYDGILIGAPGRSTATMLMFMWATQQEAREPGAWLSPAKLAMTEQHIIAQCDALDGAKDGIVSDPQACHFRPQTLLCRPGQVEGCLTAPEVRTMTAILDGPRGPDGKRITGGMPLSNMAEGWSAFLGATPPPWTDELTIKAIMAGRTNAAAMISTVVSRNVLGAKYDYMHQFDFHNPKDIAAWWDGVRRLGWGGPTSADMRPAEKLGTKVVWWAGISDAGPALDTTMAYRRAALGSLGGNTHRLDAMYRLYPIPGMLHCSGGTGPDDAPDRLLLELINWTEKGAKPGAVVAARGVEKAQPLFSKPGEALAGVKIHKAKGDAREFLLCPYPQKAKFDGAVGHEGEAAHYACAKAG